MGSEEFQAVGVDAAEHGSAGKSRRAVPVLNSSRSAGPRRCPALPRPWQTLRLRSGFPAASGQFSCALGAGELLPGCAVSSVCPAGPPAGKVGWEQG